MQQCSQSCYRTVIPTVAQSKSAHGWFAQQQPQFTGEADRIAVKALCELQEVHGEQAVSTENGENTRSANAAECTIAGEFSLFIHSPTDKGNR